jgi:hypothetical protein
MPGVNLRKFRAVLGGRGAQIKFGFAVGVAADTNMTITGIKLGDEIIAAIQVDAPNGTGTALAIANRTSVAKVTAADTIQCTAQATNSPANSQVWVLWLSKR